MLEKDTFRGRRNEFRILHISDLHMLPHQQLKQLWVSELAELEPDLVVNTGDNPVSYTHLTLPTIYSV